jgi:hypothetical protein
MRVVFGSEQISAGISNGNFRIFECKAWKIVVRNIVLSVMKALKKAIMTPVILIH